MNKMECIGDLSRAVDENVRLKQLLRMLRDAHDPNTDPWSQDRYELLLEKIRVILGEGKGRAARVREVAADLRNAVAQQSGTLVAQDAEWLQRRLDAAERLLGRKT